MQLAILVFVASTIKTAQGQELKPMRGYILAKQDETVNPEHVKKYGLVSPYSLLMCSRPNMVRESCWSVQVDERTFSAALPVSSNFRQWSEVKPVAPVKKPSKLGVVTRMIANGFAINQT